LSNTNVDGYPLDHEAEDAKDENQSLGSSVLVNSLMGLALQLTSEEWSQLSGVEKESNGGDHSNYEAKLEFLVERLTSLLLVRLLGVAASPGTFPDLSTSSICRTILVQPDAWPASISMSVLEELQAYVGRIMQWYRLYVPYHNAEHAYHVTISTNKLLDLMLGKQFGQQVVPPTFGLRHDPVRLMALVWAALVHDVDHHGVPNRQLSTEEGDHPLAIRYNDQSIAENQSLFLAFDELLHGVVPGVLDEDGQKRAPPRQSYANLRNVMCPTQRDFLLFRKHVINLVLNTDIASPERTQLSRSKFKEANFEGSQQAAAEKLEQKQAAKAAKAKPKSGLRRSSVGSNGSKTRTTPRRSVSSNVHDRSWKQKNGAPGALSSSESEMSSSEMSADTSDSESIQTIMTTDSGISEMSPSEFEETEPVMKETPQPRTEKQFERVSKDVQDGVQVTVRTASSQSLPFAIGRNKEAVSTSSVPSNANTTQKNSGVDNGEDDDDDMLKYAMKAAERAPGGQIQEKRGTSSGRRRASQEADVLSAPPSASKVSNLKKSPVDDADQTPAVPLRTASNTTSSQRANQSDQKVATETESSSGSMGTSASDIAPLAPRRRLSDGMGANSNSMKRAGSPRRQRSSQQTATPSKTVLKSKRFGIRRSMDLSGEMLQQYHSSTLQLPSLTDDQPDELKASVVMETIMTAADIAQNLQSWDAMVKWSNRLYLELRRAHASNKGPDVSRNWFKNQIGFLELYVLPLAKKMNETGVFGRIIGPSFARLVENNRDRWLLDGEKVTNDIIKEGKTLFPDGTRIPEEQLQEINLRAERAAALGVTSGAGDDREASALVGTPQMNGTVPLVSLEKELADAHQKLKTMETDHQAEIAKLSSSYDSKVEDLTHELEEMTEELSTSRNVVSTIQAERDEALKSADQLIQKDVEIVNLRKKIEVIGSENAASKSQVIRLRDHLKQHSRALPENGGSITEAEIAQALSCIHELILYRSKELTRLEGSLSELQSELAQNIIRGGMNFDDSEYLRQRLVERQHEKESLEKSIVELRGQHSRLWRRTDDDVSAKSTTIFDDRKNESVLSIEETDRLTALPREFVGTVEKKTRVLESSQTEEAIELKRACRRYEDELNRMEIERTVLKENQSSIFDELKEMIVKQHEEFLRFQMKSAGNSGQRRKNTMRRFLWSTFLFVFAMFLLWSLLWDNIVDMNVLCAPALPGTRLQPNAHMAAPFWAPNQFKEMSFQQLCPRRTWTQLGFSGQTLVVTKNSLNTDSKLSTQRIRANGVLIGTEVIVTIDDEGKYREMEAPWATSHPDNTQVERQGWMPRRMWRHR